MFRSASHFLWLAIATAWCAALLFYPASRVDAARNEALVTPRTSAYEIVVVEVEGCIYCEVFRRDVMPVFNASPEAREVSVRFVDLNAPEAANLELTEGPLTTVPTVMLVKANREYGRATGYMGPEGFFHSIRWLMNNAPSANATGAVVK